MKEKKRKRNEKEKEKMKIKVELLQELDEKILKLSKEYDSYLDTPQFLRWLLVWTMDRAYEAAPSRESATLLIAECIKFIHEQYKENKEKEEGK